MSLFLKRESYTEEETTIPADDKEPYSIKTLQYGDGVFDKHVDATYIIHLKDNGREPHIFEELQKFHPTNTVHIVYNRGFKKCDKGPKVLTSADDLTHTYLWTFEHALAEKYRNILILEDDFIFSEKIKDPATQQKIFDILESRKHEDYIFLPGCLPFLLIPRDETTYTGITGGTHCAIYSEKCIRNTLANREKIVDWDIFFNFVSETTNKYIYPEPLCYQLFPITENSKVWGIEHVVLSTLSHFVKPAMQFCRLDRQAEPGYSIFYAFSKILGILLLALVIYMIAVYPLLRNSEYFYAIFRTYVLNTTEDSWSLSEIVSNSSIHSFLDGNREVVSLG
jgi:hypothetical protein